MSVVVSSICLNPSSNYADCFTKIISSLAKRYKTPIFEPHLTVYGVLRVPQHKIEESIEYALSGISSFSIKTIKFDYSDKFTKTLYVQFSMNDKLQHIHKRLSQKLRKYLINCKEYELKPHISLIYKHGLSNNEKNNIIKTLKLKPEFLFDTCSIVTAPKPIEVENDVKNFKEAYKKSL